MSTATRDSASGVHRIGINLSELEEFTADQTPLHVQFTLGCSEEKTSSERQQKGVQKMSCEQPIAQLGAISAQRAIGW